MNKLISLIHTTGTENWDELCNQAFAMLYGSLNRRFSQAAGHTVSLRAPEFKDNKGSISAALVNKSNPNSGAHGGMSFVIFPHEERSTMIAIVVGAPRG